MLWLTWRQFRAQSVVVFAALAVFAVVLALTAGDLADLATLTGSAFLNAFTADGFYEGLYYAGIVVVYAVPAVVGAFWGAPLIARELETGTHRLAWTQTVTRARWLAVKLGLPALFVVAAAGLASLVVGWWASPVDTAFATQASGGHADAMNRLLPAVFAARGVVPMGYALFAFMLGVTAGLVVRRTVAAMAVTLAVYVAVQLLVPNFVRPHLLPPQEQTAVITGDTLDGIQADSPSSVRAIVVRFEQPGAWVVSNRTVDANGAAVDPVPSWVVGCLVLPPFPGQPKPAPQAGSGQQACFDRLAREGYRQVFTYQPASRYWPLQWIETGLYTAISALLGGFCFWWLRRRPA